MKQVPARAYDDLLRKFNRQCNDAMLSDAFVRKAGCEPSFTDGMTWRDAAIHEMRLRRKLERKLMAIEFLAKSPTPLHSSSCE